MLAPKQAIRSIGRDAFFFASKKRTQRLSQMNGRYVYELSFPDNILSKMADDIHKMNKTQLKKFLQDRNLPSSGRKSELLEKGVCAVTLGLKVAVMGQDGDIAPTFGKFLYFLADVNNLDCLMKCCIDVA